MVITSVRRHKRNKSWNRKKFRHFNNETTADQETAATKDNSNQQIPNENEIPRLTNLRMETTLGSDKRIETFVPTLEEEKTIDKIR